MKTSGKKPKSPSKRPSRKDGKNASIKEIAVKTVEAIKEKIKKPFGGKGGRKGKAEIERQKLVEAERNELRAEQEYLPADQLDTYESGGDQQSPFGNFFYINDGFITRFEDDDILAYIQQKFPEFRPGQGKESALRNSVLAMLKDSAFMTALLERYSLNVFEFFKFLFRMDSSIYRGSFIQKVQKAISRKKYASVKRHSYAFQKQVRKRSRSGKKA